MKLTSKKSKKVFLPNDPDGAMVKIKYLKPGERQQIESQSSDVTLVAKDGEQSETVVKFNPARKRKLFLEALIESWEGFFDVKDNALSVTPKNIALVDKEMEGFYEWLKDESDAYIEEIESNKAEEEGN